MKDCPNCPRRDCFGNEYGLCRVLTKYSKYPCPFFKTEEQLFEEHQKTKARLKRFRISCRYDNYDN